MEQNLDEKFLQQLQEELHTEIFPGTEIMTNTRTHHFVKAGTGSHDVLIPQPSNNENDPLNWSPMWKASAMFAATLSSFSLGMGPLALAPMFGELIVAFDSDLASVIQFTGVAILVLGFSNFLWVPIMTCFGRRPVLIFSSLICFGSSIWRAQAQSYSSFMGACVLNGIGAGPAETAQPAIITDLIFLHNRGKYNTLYFAFYFGSLMVGPIISGPMAAAVGWRNFWWLNTALLGFTFLSAVFMFPETKYPRPLAPALATVLDAPDKSTSSGMKDSEPNMTEEEESIFHQQQKMASSGGLAPTKTHQQDPYLGRGRPSQRQWRLWQSPAEERGRVYSKLLRELWIPWKLFAFPIVDFAAFVVSWSASCFLTLNLTQLQVFAAPPYGFSSQTVGFFNFAILVGGLLGLFTAGPLSDAIAARLTRRNKGIREPEMRLLAMVPYVHIMILGNVVVACGYQYHWDWRVIVIIGYTCAGIQVASLPSITSTYAVDSYKPVTGSLFVAITVNKNLWGYGFSKFITPWSESAGFIKPIMTNMTLMTVWCLCGVVFWYYGKTFRKWTRNSMVHRV